jgi:hypothetical protein
MSRVSPAKSKELREKQERGICLTDQEEQILEQQEEED